MDFTLRFERLKQRYQFYKEKDNRNPRLLKNLSKLGSLYEDPTLFAGHIKSGNTWLRFLIYNYFNVLLTEAQETLTYQELNKLQHISLLDPLEPKLPPKGFPVLARTHRHYSDVLDQFQKGIFIYRNPLDTLVSSWHFNRNLPNSNHRHLEDIDKYVLYYITPWELHTKSYLNQTRFIHLKYEVLKAQPQEELEKIIAYLGYPINSSATAKSVELSTFDSIKKMGRNNNQQYGNAGKGFKGEFTRKGITGGFKEELKATTIKDCHNSLEKFGYSYLIEDK